MEDYYASVERNIFVGRVYRTAIFFAKLLTLYRSDTIKEIDAHIRDFISEQVTTRAIIEDPYRIVN